MSNVSSTSSPVKSAQYSPFGASQPKAVDFRLKLADAMTGLFVGPMPVSQFFEDFLPAPDDLPPPPRLPKTFFNKMGKFKKESDMCKKFEDYVPAKLIPGFKIVNTSNHKDRNSTKGLRPDPTMYRRDLDTTDRTTQYNEIELHFEMKLDDSHNPFDDNPNHDFEANALKRKQCRGRLVSYATEWCSRQHRSFAFSVFMGDPFIRFIRWDRAGAIVSRKFNYREDSTPLVQFLWRLTHLGPVDRGWDPTVRLARLNEVRFAEEKLSKWKNDLHRDVMVFTVTDRGEKREFIAWGSMAYSESLTGRCTRAYPVYEIKTDRLYFLKDSWRAEGLENESAILRKLQEAGVKHIPGYVCGDDLPNDATATDLYIPAQPDGAVPEAVHPTTSLQNGNGAPVLPDEQNTAALPSGIGLCATPKKNASWRHGNNWKRITRRNHHRMVTDVIGHHLKTFSSSKEMMQAVSDAYTAHQQTYENCTIIHRDISAHNILITDDGHGILNDWDLARYEKDIIANGPRQHERTGTWQFMSCLLLRQKDKSHTIQDDMESFVYIILYHCLRYLEHNKRHFLKLILQKIFDEEDRLDDGTRLGGDSKRFLFSSKGANIAVYDGFELTNHAPLNDWLDCAFDIVDEWLSKVAVSKRSPPVKKEQLVGLRLFDHRFMAEQFALQLSQPGWPSEDKAADALPAHSGARTGSQIGSMIGSSTGSVPSRSSQKRSPAPEDSGEGSEGARAGPKKQKTSKPKTS